VDGIVTSGEASIDEQLLTGRSEPSAKETGFPVYAGTQIIDGTLQIRAGAIGTDTAAARLTEKLRDLLARTSAGSETVSRLQADRAVVPTLVASAGALLTGGLTGFRAALRPDFLTGPAIAEEMAGLTAVIHAANEGVIWGERPALDILRTADYYVFDDSVEWSEDKRARDEFRSATRGLGEPVLFTSLEGDEAAAKAGRLGFRVFRPASTPDDVVRFLEEKRELDQPAVYVGTGVAEGATAALQVAVVSPPFHNLARASLALLSPDLGKFGLLLNLAWQTRQDSEKAFRLTLLPNIAAIAAAIILRSPAMASVVLTNLGTLTNYVRSAAILQLASAGGSRRKLS
jgi:cation transport ATPase